MRKLILLCSLFVLGLSAGCSLSDDAAHTRGGPTQNTGELHVSLLAVASVRVSEVHYKVTVPERGSLEGTLPVGQDGTISGVVSEVPASAGVTVTLSAMTADGGTCTGEGTVTVVAGETTAVSIVLQCRLPDGTPVTTGSIEINGSLNVCPQVSAAAATPTSTETTSAVTSTSADLDGDTLTIAWTATSGSFSDAAAANSTYTCASSGEQTLTVTADDGKGCTHNKTVTVTCTAVTPPAPVCGNGTKEGSEACDDGNTTAGDGCSATCTVELPPAPACGNNTKEEGEACDDGNTTAGDGCSATCTVEPPAPPAGLSCEPPLADACTECTCTSCGTEVAACKAATGNASEGPGTGQAKSALCEALVLCGRAAGCRGTTCFCGAADLVTCITGGAAGPCMNEVLAASETTDGTVVATRQTDTKYAVGLANAVSTCTVNSCDTACGGGTTGGT